MDKVIAIIGPTAVGKTKLSIELAKRYNGEIINADSTQIYRGMDIATAKVTEEEQEGIPHHLLNIRNMDEDYTVYNYQRDCRKKIEEILHRKKTPILVGGSGLYINAALFDYQFEEESQLHPNYSSYSNDELFKSLLVVDPDTSIHPNNRKRVERALSYYDKNKKPLGSKEKTNRILYDVLWIGLTVERETLYEKINQRVDIMVEKGLLEEAKQIYQSNIRTKAVLTPIGYKELFPYFDETDSLENCLEKMKQNSRKYAKRQYTWFTRKMPVIWFKTEYEQFEITKQAVIKYVEENE